MKKALLAVFAAVLFFNTVVIPTVAHADGGSSGANCDGSTSNCKP